MNFIISRSQFTFILKLLLLLTITVIFCSPHASAHWRQQSGILFIYNHGSSNHWGLDCFSFTPKWVRRLNGRVIDGRKIRVEKPCTGFEKGNYPKNIDGCGEVWVCNRANAIVKKIEKAIKRGYDPKYIFVGGHSAGGWSSLLIKRWQPGLFNSVIAVAPAFNGKRRRRLCANDDCSAKTDWDAERIESEQFRKLRSLMRTKHDKQLGLGSSNAPNLRALVFSFPCDPYGHPDDLQFKNKSVRHITFPAKIGNVETRNIGCSISKKVYRYHGDNSATETTKCVESKKKKPSPKLSCGSGEKADPTYARILKCDEKWDSYCALDQHAKAHRSVQFRDYIDSTDMIVKFITKQLESWQPVSYRATKGGPCAFLGPPKICK